MATKIPGLGDLARTASASTEDPAISLQRIAESFVGSDWDALTEASLGRIHQHWKNSGTKSFAIVTSWRSAHGKGENEHRFSKLKADVRSQGYGYNRMTGVGEEENGGMSKEPSLFVHGMSYHHAVEHGKKHDQHSIIYSGPETKGEVHLVHLKDDGDKKAGDHTSLGKFHPKKIGQYYSKIRNRDFTFAEEIKGWKYEGENVGEAEVLSLLVKRLLEARQGN